MSKVFQLICLLSLAASPYTVSAQTTFYVSLEGSHTPPFNSWATAATNIQDAVDAAGTNDTVLVTNGIYETGGRVVSTNLLTNRVVIDKPIPVRSVNGPAFTIIKGAKDPITLSNGNAAIRCAYLTNGASLSGFTLTNGATRPYVSGSGKLDEFGGGVYSEVAGALSNCVLTGNSASFGGGGAYRGTLNNCTIVGNSVDSGVTGSGGGAYLSTLNNCTIAGNWALIGGGTYQAKHYNSIIYFNSALNSPNHNGSTTFSNCCTTPIIGNTGSTPADPQFENRGGGNLRVKAASPCRDTGINALAPGSTDFDGNPRILNGIVDMGAYEFIVAPGDDFIIPSAITSSTFATDSFPATNLINASGLSGAPEFTNLGTHAAAADSNAWVTAANAPSYYPTLPVPVLTCTLPGTNVFALSELVIWGYHFGSGNGNEAKTFDLTFSIDGTNYSQSTTVTSATLLVSGGFRLPFPAARFARYVRVAITTNHYLAAADGDRVGLGELRFIGQIENPMYRFVSPSGSHTPPFITWDTAATNIQAAVDAAGLLDTVLVTNGIYETGGRVVSTNLLTNRVVIDKPIPVSSVNGPAFTIIKGAKDPITLSNGNAAIRCVYLTNGASLSGFTLTNGATRPFVSGRPDENGGGVYSEDAGALFNCLLTGNSAGGGGGGAYRGTLNNCTISGNRAGSGGGALSCTLNNCTISGNAAGSGGGGGGALQGTLNNCTISGNSALNGGGTRNATLNNCIVYFNTSGNGSNYFSCTFNYTCTAPLPNSGTGNTSADPLFENRLAGNFRLTVNSPCRNTGSNALARGATDLDGNARTNGPTVDMGAYEFINTDTDGDGMPDWWETLHGLNPAASNSPAANDDADASTDWEEYIADTNPTNPASYFPAASYVVVDLSTNEVPDLLHFVSIPQTYTSRTYSIYALTNLLDTPQNWTLIPPELPGNNTELLFPSPHQHLPSHPNRCPATVA